ncbi:MAG: SDR family oxidoreductase [Candidatus Thalassarchaeum sp.]|nr:SDR family oxidoreductase [Candidatus Thalassarchaeum sp.]MDB3855038.1 SDR family oxidoreductase [Euryarchaeota archaeon]
METGLNDSVVLVTGGAGGIGEAICRAFASEGSQVVVHYHESSENAEKIAKEIGGLPIKADLRDHKQALSLINTVVEKYGKLDICIANAGYYPPESLPLWDIDNDRWNEVISSNLGVAVNTARVFLREASRAGSGSLVFIGSTAGIYGESGHSDYAAAKGAITSGLLMSLKNDVSKIGNVRVNAVAPGWTITPKKKEQGIDDELIKNATATMSLKKLATPEDIANTVVSISSDLISGHITGQIIEIAGGMEGRLV